MFDEKFILPEGRNVTIYLNDDKCCVLEMKKTPQLSMLLLEALALYFPVSSINVIESKDKSKIKVLARVGNSKLNLSTRKKLEGILLDQFICILEYINSNV